MKTSIHRQSENTEFAASVGNITDGPRAKVVRLSDYSLMGEGLHHHSLLLEASMSSVYEPDGVEFVHEDDGRVTARHLETGVASFGDTEAEALRHLADALDSHSGEGEDIDDPEAYLESLGIDVEIGEEGPPPWLE